MDKWIKISISGVLHRKVQQTTSVVHLEDIAIRGDNLLASTILARGGRHLQTMGIGLVDRQNGLSFPLPNIIIEDSNNMLTTVGSGEDSMVGSNR